MLCDVILMTSMVYSLASRDFGVPFVDAVRFRPGYMAYGGGGSGHS